MVSRTLLTRLGEEQHGIYRTFIKTKVQLLVEQRLLVERTEAASLQLEALQKDSQYRETVIAMCSDTSKGTLLALHVIETQR